MRPIQLFVLIVLLMAVSVVFAVDNGQSKAFGVRLGNSSGNGYSYRMLNNGTGLQVVLGAMTSGDNDVKFANTISNYTNEPTIEIKKTGRKTSASVGVNWINHIASSSNTNFYFTVGGAYLYSRRNEHYQTYEQSSSNSYNYEIQGSAVTDQKNRDTWTVGVGPGVELFADKNLRLCIELPITFNSDDEVIPYIPQAGIYYYFK